MPTETTVFDMGDTVMCDLCGENYTTGENSTLIGGLLFGSSAVCPKCEPRIAEDAKKYGEESFIRARANAGETFKAFCLRLRGGDNRVIIQTMDRDTFDRKLNNEKDA